MVTISCSKSLKFGHNLCKGPQDQIVNRRNDQSATGTERIWHLVHQPCQHPYAIPAQSRGETQNAMIGNSQYNKEVWEFIELIFDKAQAPVAFIGTNARGLNTNFPREKERGI